MNDPRSPATAQPADPATWAGHAVERYRAGGLAVRAAGTGPLLLLLHGGFGSWNHWIRNVDALAAEFRVVVPDLPGMGESSAALAQDITLDAYLDLVRAAFDDGLLPEGARFCVAGFSYGAIMTACLTRLLADRIRAAVLIAPGSFPAGSVNRLPLKPIPPGLSDAEIDAIHRHNMETLLIHDGRRIDAAAVAAQRWNIEHTRFSARLIGYGDHLGDYLPHARCPILFLIGAHDAMPHPSAEARAAYISGLNPAVATALVPDAGHWAMFEQPAWINARLLAFFRKAPA